MVIALDVSRHLEVLMGRVVFWLRGYVRTWFIESKASVVLKC